ncbi:MAG: hypothetical protein HYY17_05990 [Planctomycetes bacterium]|nr:hypothetical protein [Planctomycetota bacterium]
MMRAAAVVVCLLFRQDTAQDLFKKVEKKLSSAKSLSLKFKGEMSAEGEKAEISGSLRLKSGDRYVFSLNMVRGDDKRSIEARSDGKTVVSTTDGKTSEEPVKEGVTKFLTAAISRTGFMIAFMTLSPGGKKAPIPNPDEALKVSGFEKGASGKIGGKDVFELKFQVALKGMQEIRVALTVEDGTLVPRRIETRLKQDTTEILMVETYEDFSTDEIPDAEFEPKK